MRLNGWQRIWVVSSFLWAGWMGLWALGEVNRLYARATDQFPVTPWEWQAIVLIAIVVAVVPIAIAYAAGATVAWIRRGFTDVSPR